MKKVFFILLICLVPAFSFASSVFWESFEYANHDMTIPMGWTCDDQSWLCGHLDKDHNRTAHSGEWYAFTNADDSWMFMPLWISSQLRYRFSSWVISDGTYELEFWAGTEGNAEHMNQHLFTVTVSGDQYEYFSEYIESITADYEYFGIHAIASEGAYHLTIDDINVDMVNKYEFITNPSSASTALYPGEQVLFRFNVINLGYEPIDVIFIPSYEYFTNIYFTVEGTTDLDCSCATAMTTLWVTVMDPDGIDEHENEESVLQVEVFDLTGKKVDPSHLKAGIYLERTISEKGVTTRKTVIK